MQDLSSNVWRRSAARIAISVERIWCTRAWLLLALVPPAVLTWLVIRFGVDLPFWDEWALVPHLRDLRAGELRLVELWYFHNEHRPLVPKLVMLGLASLTGWNIRAEMIVSLVLGGGICASLCLLFVRGCGLDREAFRFRLGVVPLVSLVVFSLTQVENWTWGWQIQIFLNVLAVCVGLVLLQPAKTSGLRLAGAALCGWVASYSFVNGLLFWLVGLPLVSGEGPERDRRRTLWLASAAICWLTYVPMGEDPGVRLSFAPGRYLLYTCAYLGAPLFPHHRRAAVVVGALAVFVFVLAVNRLVGPARRAAERQWLQTWAALGAYAVGSALLTAIGRSHFGIEQALSSRYTTISQLLWLALLGLALGFTEEGVDAQRRRRLVLPCFLVLAGLVAWRSSTSAVEFPRQYQFKTELRDALLESPRPEVLGQLYPLPDEVAERVRVLRQLRLSFMRREPELAQRDLVHEAGD